LEEEDRHLFEVELSFQREEETLVLILSRQVGAAIDGEECPVLEELRI
jgi:hypothetical protein